MKDTSVLVIYRILNSSSILPLYSYSWNKDFMRQRRCHSYLLVIYPSGVHTCLGLKNFYLSPLLELEEVHSLVFSSLGQIVPHVWTTLGLMSILGDMFMEKCKHFQHVGQGIHMFEVHQSTKKRGMDINSRCQVLILYVEFGHRIQRSWIILKSDLTFQNVREISLPKQEDGMYFI